MFCLNCGKENNAYLCEACRTEEILDYIWKQIYCKIDFCENKYIKELAESLEYPFAYRNCIPDIIKLFDKDIAEYYLCRYYYQVRDQKFEESALAYINLHGNQAIRSQILINCLLIHYAGNEFYKPAKWCEWICFRQGIAYRLKFQVS